METHTVFLSEGLVIRRIIEADLPAILEIYRQCEDFLALGPISVASLSMVKADIAQSVAAHGIYCLIINSEGTPVGVLDFIEESGTHTATLSLLMVGRSHRNRGIGTTVMSSLQTYLADKGVTTIDSGVQVNNKPAIRFWRRHGFCIGTQPIYHADGTIAYDMSKDISPKSISHSAEAPKDSAD